MEFTVIGPDVLDQRDTLAAAFRQAQRFRHAVVEDFFEPDCCRRILDDFPRFEDISARDRKERSAEDLTFLYDREKQRTAQIVAMRVADVRSKSRRCIERRPRVRLENRRSLP